MVDVQAIGAGGGSIAGVEEGGYLYVGPESAGAEPGPACYGRGGERPTVTDADLVLGILDPSRFLGGKLQLDVDMARQSIQQHVAEPLGMTIEAAAAAIKRVVDVRMSDLLRTVTLAKGHDPREFVLFAFGGAGATHAPSFALDVVDEVFVPFSQSVFCAFGAVASDISLKLDHTQPTRLTREGKGDLNEEDIKVIFETLEQKGNEALALQNVPSAQRSLKRNVEIRFIRQSKNLTVPYSDSIIQLTNDFLSMYAKRYGEESIPETAGFELVTFFVEAIGTLSRPELAIYAQEGRDSSAALRGSRMVYEMSSGEFIDTPVYDGDLLTSGNQFQGPAIVEYEGTTISILSGQIATVNKLLGISIKRAKK
jgi:N-methylhydantoinase A